jgi:lauroyl/myristoyl acyltransferase
MAGLVRLLPLSAALAAVDHFGRLYAQAALRERWLPLPAAALAFPSELGRLLGTTAGSADRARQIEEYLAGVLTNELLVTALDARPASDYRSLLRSIDVRGREHLDRALRGGRGLLLVSAHFGFPYAIQPVVAGLGVPWVAVGVPRPHADRLAVTADIWTRARVLHQLETELANDHLGIMLVDGRQGEAIRLPFLHGEVTIALGAFILAQRIRSPLVPFFVVAPDRPPRFRVEFGPPLTIPVGTGVRAAREPVEEFVQIYRAYVEQYPTHCRPDRLRPG